MKLSKAQRATLRELFGGVCAYCGQPLGDRWHADHKEPIMRGYEEKTADNPHGAWHVHRDTIENLMPACAPCNLDKASYSLEYWRTKLEGSAESLARYSSTYRHAFRFGLVAPVQEKVKFHFERKQPSSLAKQIADAQAEYDSWSPEKRASVVLQGAREPTRGSLCQKDPNWRPYE